AAAMSGVSATRRSPGAISLGTAIFMGRRSGVGGAIAKGRRTEKGTASWPSPGVDAGPLLAAARRGRRDGAERGHDPFPGLGRVDDVVDLEVGGVADGLPVLVHARDHPLEERLAGGRVLHRRQLLSVAELYRALEPHA